MSRTSREFIRISHWEDQKMLDRGGGIKKKKKETNQPYRRINNSVRLAFIQEHDFDNSTKRGSTVL